MLGDIKPIDDYLNGYTSERFLERIASDFEVEFVGKDCKPVKKGNLVCI